MEKLLFLFATFLLMAMQGTASSLNDTVIEEVLELIPGATLDISGKIELYGSIQCKSEDMPATLVKKPIMQK